MYLDHNETLRGQTIIIDPNIHKQAKITRDKFLEKVSCVKSIRTSYNSNYISFYITSLEEYSNLKKFYDLINTGVFSFSYNKVFAIAVQPKLYEWFKNTAYDVIEKQIVGWLAASYYFQPEKRSVKKEQLYKPLFDEILELVDKHFKSFSLPDFDLLNDKLFNDSDETLFSEIEKCNQKYLQFCNDFYQAEPPEFLKTPFGYETLPEWGVNDCHNFEFVWAYFTDSDWERIIVKDKPDNLQRSESRDDLWEKWKHTYQTFDQRNNFVYSFFFNPTDTKTEKIGKKRETIPQDVKDKVWQRDNGKCVECDSKENLEFDHIIPFSKGGSSTYRNIQLLCEPCNRKKHAKIGDTNASC